MRNWLLPLWLACAAGGVQADEFTARVIIVLDGDTVMAVRHCNRDGAKAAENPVSYRCATSRPFKIRLAEIDAPEKAQSFGADSQKSLAGLVLRKVVGVNILAVDKYGRRVAHLAVNGKSVNEEQVRRGMAWEYSSYHSNKSYIALQNEARQARRGLWAEAGAIPPWEWRKLHTTDAPAPERKPSSTAPAPRAGFSCGRKHRCTQMRSCAEARFYLSRCGVLSLDSNRDGVPCEALCSPSGTP